MTIPPREIFDRAPPHDSLAEMSVNGAAILDPSALPAMIEAGYRSGVFHDGDNRQLAASILSAYSDHGTIDKTLILAALKPHEDALAGRNAMALLIRTVEATPTAANWPHHLGIVTEHSAKRQTFLIGQRMLTGSLNGATAADIASEAREALEEISDAANRSGAIVVNMADVVAKPVSWLWPSRVALGKLTLISGDPGLGKSFLSLDIASRVSTGAKWPDCDDHAPQGGAVILSAEDDLEDTIRPRLDAAGADVGQIVAIQGVQFRDDRGDCERAIDLQRDLPILEQAIERMPNCKVVVVDPVSAYMGSTDSHKDAEVRAVLAPLAKMAARKGFAVLAITHLRKSEGRAVHRTMGSLAFAAAARAVWAVASDPEDSTGSRRLFLPVKNNVGNDRTGLAYRLSKRFAESDDQPCVEWFADIVSQLADDVLAPQRRRGPAPEERDEAIQFLADALADGPRPAAEVADEAKQTAGISKSTIDRAKKAMGVIAFRPENPGKWYWKMPDTDAAEAGSQVSRPT